MPSLNTENAILSNAIKVNSSYNVGIGGAASGSFKLNVTGTSNLTGALSGTSATFSGLIQNTDGYQGKYFRIFEASAQRGGFYTYNVISGAGTDYSLGLFSESSLWFAAGGGVTKHLTIASTGAATFSSSVSANSTIVQSSGEDGSSGPVMRLTSTNPNASSRNWAMINTWDNFGDLTFRVSNAKDGNALTAGSTRMVILANGNVGIGTSSPSAKLYVINSSTTQSSYYAETSSASYIGSVMTSLCFTAASTSWNHFIGYSSIGSTTDIKILGNGNIQNANNSYGSLSDIKLKENIIDASPKLDKLIKVKIRNYNLLGSEMKQIGVIAQELEEIFPSMIEETEDFEQIEVTDEEGNVIKENQSLGTTTKSVKYSVFVPILIKAIQEQQAQIEELRQIVATK